MSFSSDVKKEICSVEQFDREALKAELYGMLLFSRNFSPNKITFTTESNYAGNRLIFLLQNLYMPIIEKQSALRTKSSDSHLYKIIVVDGNDCKRIFEDFGYFGKNLAQILRKIFERNTEFKMIAFHGIGYRTAAKKNSTQKRLRKFFA